MSIDPFYFKDSWLQPYAQAINSRHTGYLTRLQGLSRRGSLRDFATGHLYYGMHRDKEGLVFREWAPGATSIFLTGSFNGWQEEERFRMTRMNSEGDWELRIGDGTLSHGDLYKLIIYWQGGSGERIPSYSVSVIQDEKTKIFSSVNWMPERQYSWKNSDFVPQNENPVIYEAHVGMSSEDEKVSTFDEFRENILPRIRENGYNTIQLMAVQEHPYYGSFGYHVSNFFAVSSRFGTPDDLKALVSE